MTPEQIKTSIKPDSLEKLRTQLVSTLSEIEPKNQKERSVLIYVSMGLSSIIDAHKRHNEPLPYSAIEEGIFDLGRDIARETSKRYGNREDMIEEMDIISVLNAKVRSCYEKCATLHKGTGSGKDPRQI